MAGNLITFMKLQNHLNITLFSMFAIFPQLSFVSQLRVYAIASPFLVLISLLINKYNNSKELNTDITIIYLIAIAIPFVYFVFTGKSW